MCVCVWERERARERIRAKGWKCFSVLTYPRWVWAKWSSLEWVQRSCCQWWWCCRRHRLWTSGWFCLWESSPFHCTLLLLCRSRTCRIAPTTTHPRTLSFASVRSQDSVSPKNQNRNKKTNKVFLPTREKFFVAWRWVARFSQTRKKIATRFVSHCKTRLSNCSSENSGMQRRRNEAGKYLSDAARRILTLMCSRKELHQLLSECWNSH